MVVGHSIAANRWLCEAIPMTATIMAAMAIPHPQRDLWILEMTGDSNGVLRSFSSK